MKLGLVVPTHERSGKIFLDSPSQAEIAPSWSKSLMAREESQRRRRNPN
jgi:hypothetical protein